MRGPGAEPPPFFFHFFASVVHTGKLGYCVGLGTRHTTQQYRARAVILRMVRFDIHAACLWNSAETIRYVGVKRSQ